jgi:hypothetical protein
MNTKKIIIGVIVVVLLLIILTTSLNNGNDDVVVGTTNSGTSQEIQVDRGGAAELSIIDAESKIIGSWRSTDDSKSVEVFRADGTVVSRYDGEDVTEGAWTLIQDATAEYDPSGVFLEITITDERFTYAIVEIEEGRLLLNYLIRGNMLEYTKI